MPVAGIMELAGRAASVDGVAAISGHLLDALAAGTVDSLLVTAVDGSVIGAAVAVGGDPAEIVVEPPFRRHGRGSALVQAALDRQGAVWAYGDLPAAAALAQRLGLVRGRVLLQMRRRSPTGPTTSAASTGHPLPEGVRVRTFVPGQDEEALLAVNANAFARHPEQGRLDLPGLQAEMAQSWFDPNGLFLAVTAGKTLAAAGTPGSSERILGFHWTKVHQQDPNPGSGGRPGPIGEVYVLGVDPEAGVRGLGTALTAIGLDHLSRRRLRTVMLYVEGDNDRARALYERFGFATFLTNAVYARPAPTSR